MSDSEKLDVILGKLAKMERLHDRMLLKRPSQTELARKSGVSVTTLWRRRKREEMRRLVAGGSAA
jgi:hypothetical protein